MRLLLALCTLALSGCADTLRIELEHVSHPLAGVPFGPASDEDALTQVSALLNVRRDAAYMEFGLGYNLRGADGGGFYGPGLTGIVRAGYVIDLKRSATVGDR